MFAPAELQTIYHVHHQTFARLHELEQMLNQRFVGLDTAIRGLVLAIATGEPLLLIGPPGTAKSRLIRAFCGLLGVIDPDNPAGSASDRYFEYLLTPFTEPSELFGFYDLAALNRGETLMRLDRGMMQRAEIVFLDEVFNGSSAILNAILSFMNEKLFHDRGERIKVRMQCLVAASNDVPRAKELRAVYDRFLLRCRVGAVEAEPDALAGLIERGWSETYSRHQTAPELDGLMTACADLRSDIVARTVIGELSPDRDEAFLSHMTELVATARQYHLSAMSNRRIVKLTHLMLIHRLLRAASDQLAVDAEAENFRCGAAELALIPDYLLDLAEDDRDREIVSRMQRMALREDD